MKRKAVLLRLLPEYHERFVAQAKARDLPLTKWLIQAGLAYESKGARFAKAKKWPVCSICQKRHDREEHFPVSE